MNLFCKHTWKELKHFEIPSEADALIKIGLRPNTCTGLRRIYVTDYTCEKCGKIKRFKTQTLG